MINETFIDSSVLIEYNKGSKTKLFSSLLDSRKYKCYINETVVSEFLYHYLAKNSDTSPKTLQRKNKIAEVFATSTQYSLMHLFEFLPTDASIYNLVPDFMLNYNLLPNDAIILAACKIHNIIQLASHDKDFIEPCKAEGITLLTE